MERAEIQAIWLQLEALGYIERLGSQEKVRLTKKGVKYAAELLQKLPLDQRILIGMYAADFARNYAESKQ